MKRILLIVMLIMPAVLPLAAMAAQPPGRPSTFVLDMQALEKNRRKVTNKDAALLPAYKLLLKDAGKALEFGPVSVMEKKNVPPSGDRHDYMSLAPYYWPDPTKADGLPYIRKDGQTNPEVKDYKDKEYLPVLCGSVHTLALAYYFSGENKYAEHAARLLRVWFLDTATRMNPNLNFGQAMKGHNNGRGAGLIDTRHFVKVIDAAGLLQGSKSWSAADDQSMKKWCTDFLNWMQTSKVGKDELNADNNHGAWYDAQRLALALYTGDKDLAGNIVRNAQNRLDKQMDNDGRFPLEMQRTISLHYTVFAMNAFFDIARMAEKTGIDFWNYVSPSGKSLKKGFDALKPYITQEKTWEGPQIKPYDYEDSYALLMEAALRFNCKDCTNYVNTLAGDKAGRLRLKLYY